MDTLMVVLRLVHIFAGIAWVGAGFFMMLVLIPLVQQMGAEGGRFMQSFAAKSRFGKVMLVSSLLTTLSGLWLYYRVSDHFNSDWMSASAGVVLSIGSVAGVLAFGHGAAQTGPGFDKMGSLARQIEAQGGPPTEAQMAEMHALGERNMQHGRISVLLEIIAVVGMAAARYM